MEENVGKLGIVVFFNVLFTGGIFIICASWISFYYRVKKIMNYKARMLMEVYDICMVIKKEDANFSSCQ